MTINRIEILKSYVDEDPHDAFSRYALALEYIKLENDSAAEPLMEFLFNELPEYLPNYYHYGKLIERKGDFGSAEYIYKIGIEQCKSKNDTHTMNELQGALDSLDF